MWFDPWPASRNFSEIYSALAPEADEGVSGGRPALCRAPTHIVGIAESHCGGSYLPSTTTDPTVGTFCVNSVTVTRVLMLQRHPAPGDYRRPKRELFGLLSQEYRKWLILPGIDEA